MPCFISALFFSKAAFSSDRNLSASALALAMLASSPCKVATSSLSLAEAALSCAIFVDNLSLSAVRSSFFAFASDISLSQYALCEASASASDSNVAIISVIKLLTLAKGSSPAAAPSFIAEDILDANCARAGEFDFRARSRMKRTASNLARSALEASCMNETWFIPYVCSAAPPVLSLMTFLATANALSSSPRLLVANSNSSAAVMQSWWRVAFVFISSARSLEVTSRSPSAVAFFS
mmetsp:Transcript_94943/g.149464  ORF Transcript_94943/g.149464 Transcript_94943/m.149464 type:complete len:237 (+) Transcript_94943:728-1438(+)